MNIKLQKDWKEIRLSLHRALKEFDGSPSDLAKGAKIDYFSARRYLLNGPENQTESSIALCTFFKIDIFMQNKDLLLILNAAYENWDGTSDHARSLVELLKWSKSFGKTSNQERR